MPTIPSTQQTLARCPHCGARIGAHLGRGIPHSEGGTRKTTVLGRAVREARLKQGYLQTRLAERVGITRQALSRIELGMNRPSQRVFAALEEILGKRLPSKNSDTTATNTNN